MIFNRDNYLRQSSRLQAWGWSLFLGGLVMLVVDATTPFPTPARGMFALYWVVFAVVGLYCLRQCELLIRGCAEKLLRSEYTLTVDDVSRQLNLNPADARAIMELLVERRAARVKVSDTPLKGDDSDYVIEML